MKVKAKKMCFDGLQRIRPGEVVVLDNPKLQFSKSGMINLDAKNADKEVEADETEKATKAKKSVADQVPPVPAISGSRKKSASKKVE